jgi:hypothetical protein
VASRKLESQRAETMSFWRSKGFADDCKANENVGGTQIIDVFGRYYLITSVI